MVQFEILEKKKKSIETEIGRIFITCYLKSEHMCGGEAVVLKTIFDNQPEGTF